MFRQNIHSLYVTASAQKTHTTHHKWSALAFRVRFVSCERGVRVGFALMCVGPYNFAAAIKMELQFATANRRRRRAFTIMGRSSEEFRSALRTKPKKHAMLALDAHCSQVFGVSHRFVVDVWPHQICPLLVARRCSHPYSRLSVRQMLASSKCCRYNSPAYPLMLFAHSIYLCT